MTQYVIRRWLVALGVLAVLLAAWPGGMTAFAQGNLDFEVEILAALAEGAEHSYTFSSEGSEIVTVIMNAQAETLDPVLELYTPAGGLLAFNDDVEVGNPDAALRDIFLSQAGVYTLVARAYGNTGSGDYLLYAERAEIGEGTAGGGVIALGETVEGAILVEGQLDYWTFDGAAGQTVSIALDHTADSALDPLVELQGPDGQILTFSDDDGGNLNSLINGFTLPADGAYTIVARSWGNSTTGAYTLTLSEGEALAAGNTGIIALNDSVTATLELGLWDEWSFTGEAGQVISIAILSPDFDTTLTLWDANGIDLYFDDDGGPEFNSLIANYELPFTGEYLIEVGSYADSGGGAYTLSLTVEDGSAVAIQATPTLAPTIPPPPPTGGGIIEPGQTIEAAHNAGIEDRWTFTAQAGDVFSMALYGDFDTTMSLYNASGSEIEYNDDGGPGLNSQINGWEAPASGVYTIGVNSFGNDDSGTYSLTLARGAVYITPDGWAQGALALGETITGNLTEEAPSHLWTFQAEAGQFLTLDYEGDGYPEVLTETGGYPGFYLDTGVPAVIDEAGTYLLLINGYRPGEYTLTLNEAPPPQANTGNIEVGQTVTATLDYGATDEWTLVLSAGDEISIAVYSEAIDTYLYIFDDTGSELDRNDDGGPGLNSMLRGWEAPADGAYTLRVRDFGDNSSGDYSLTVAGGDVFLLPDGWDQGELALGEPVSGAFDETIQTHIYTFTAEAGQFLLLDYGNLSGYTEVSTSDGGYTNIYFETGVPEYIEDAGTYLLFVYGYSEGEYTLTLSEAPPPQANTGNIEVRQTITATLDYGATDEWTLVLREGDEISVALYAAAFDPVLAIVDEAGAEVAYNDDGGLGGNSLIRGWTTPADGAYVIQARDRSMSSTGSYTLSVAAGDEFLLPDEWDQGFIPLGEPVTGTLSDDTQTHIWGFESGAGQYFVLDYDWNTVYVEVLDSDGNYYTYIDPGANTRFDDSGVYYLMVEGYQPGDYTLTLSAGEPPEANTGPIEYGQTITMELDGGAEDLWSFTGQAGDVVTIAIFSDDFDTYLHLEDDSGFELTYNDDGGPGLNSLIEAYALPADGTYTIRVRSFGRRSGGLYELTLSSGAGDFEPSGGVNAIAVGSTVEAALVEGTQDVWSFTAAAGDVFTLALYGDFDTYLYLYNENGQELDHDDDGGPGLNSQIIGWEAPADGTYYITVDSFGGYSGGNYALTLAAGDAFIFPPGAMQGELALGETVEASFPADSEAGYLSHYYTLSVEAGQYLQLSYGPNVSVEVYTADGDYGPYFSSAPLRMTEDATYTLEVQGYPGDSYFLTVEEIEPAEANTGNIEVGQTVTATLGMTATDEWTFVAEEGDVVTISLYGTFDTYLHLYDADGQELDYNDDGGPSLNSRLAGWEVPADGAYVIGVRAFADSATGDYELTLSSGTVFVVPESWQQGELALAEPVSGAMTEDAQTHVYTLTAETEEGFYNLESDSSLYAEALTTDGDFVTYIDPGVPATLAAGDYLIFVYGYAASDYTFTLSEIEPPQANTGNVEVGQTITATLDYGATDEWTIALSEGDVISVGVYSSAIDTYLYIFDEDGNELARNDDTVNLNSMIRGWEAPADGAYTLRVRDFGDNSVGEYQVIVVAGDEFVLPAGWDQGALPFDEDVTASFDEGVPLHIWSFEAGAGQALILDYSYDELYVNVRTADGRYFGYFEPGEPLVFEEAGVYLLLLEGYSDSYTIRLSADADAGPVVEATEEAVEEPQEAAAEEAAEAAVDPQALVPGQPVQAELAEGETAAWSFAARAGDVWTIAAYSSAFDTMLFVFDASGSEIGYDDDGGVGLNSLIRGWEVPADGLYTINVRDFGGNDDGPYTLLVLPGDQFVLPPGWDQGPVPFGVAAGSFNEDGPPHVWQFAASAASVPLSLLLTFDGPPLQAVEIWDADGSYLLSVPYGEAFTLENAGGYYLVFYNGGVGDYTFSLSVVADAAVAPPAVVVTETPLPTLPPPPATATLPPPTLVPTPTAVAPVAGATASIAFGQALTGDLAPGTYDQWEFMAEAGQVITITLDAEQNAFDTTLTLLGPDGNEIAFDDDSGPVFNSMLADFTLPAEGLYTIIVGSYTGMGSGAYTVTLNAVSGSDGA